MGVGVDGGGGLVSTVRFCPVPWWSLPDEEAGTTKRFPRPGAGVLAGAGMLEYTGPCGDRDLEGGGT